MTDSNNNNDDVQKGREIYEFPISLLRLFGINVTNLLGRRQFYRGLSGKSLFPSEITDLIEDLMVRSIVEEKERKSGAGRLIGVSSDKVEFSYFFEYAVSPKKMVWLFYLNTTPSVLESLAERLVSKNIPDFKSLGLPFYSSETIIFLEKSAFGEAEVSPSIIEKHLDKFLEINKIYKARLLRADYECCLYSDTESGSSDDEEETESESDVSDILEEFSICENWFIKSYIITELKSKSLEKLYSDDADSKRTERKIRNLLIVNSTESSRLSKDPVFIVSKDLNALVELGDSTTEKISLKGKEWTEFLKKKETLGVQTSSFLNQELSQSGFPFLLAYHLHKIFRTYDESLEKTEEILENSLSLGKLLGSVNIKVEKYLVGLERLEKCEGEKGDEKKDGKEGKKPEYGYQYGKHKREVAKYLSGSKETGSFEEESKELASFSNSIEELRERFAKLDITDLQLNETKEENFEQILYRVQKDN